MISVRPVFAALLLLGGLMTAPVPARAAESYDSCTGFIDSLPATISGQGVWCLRKDLSTSITSGYAITIANNNVTIDCNDFKLGGLGAGDSSLVYGIYANDRLNATVRQCNIRGFYTGMLLVGGGHLIENNRVEQSLYIGINVYGDNNVVRRNRVYDTGGSYDTAYGISASADVIDNIVDGVFGLSTPAYPSTYPYGIAASSGGQDVRGNRVRGLAVAGSGTAYGIYVLGVAGTVDGNRVSATAVTPGTGIVAGSAGIFCRNNTVARFNVAMSGCQDAGGNASN